MAEIHGIHSQLVMFGFVVLHAIYPASDLTYFDFHDRRVDPYGEVESDLARHHPDSLCEFKGYFLAVVTLAQIIEKVTPQKTLITPYLVYHYESCLLYAKNYKSCDGDSLIFHSSIQLTFSSFYLRLALHICKVHST